MTDKANPANRMPHAPSPRLESFKSIHGARLRLSALPNAKHAMVRAPSKACPVSAATMSAEYSKPQGMKAHKFALGQ
jgi:hypothetical protein